MEDPVPAPLRRRGTKHPYRRRARIACVCCHDRKVRCDVAVNGNPCTNCRLDGNKCSVKDRGTKLYDIAPTRTIALAKAASTTIDPTVPLPEDDDALEAILTDFAHQAASDVPLIQDVVTPSQVTEMEGVLTRSLDPALSASALDLDLTKSAFPVLSETFPDTLPQPLIDDMQFNISNSFSPSFTSDFSHVLYTYYPFLRLDPISHLPAEDVNFLERKRCFHVPCRLIVDEFVAKYFLHVHPGLPHILESEFWHMYLHPGHNRSIEPLGRLSLFVFQCMLFAGCSFVPLSTLQKCGFSSIRDARASFYRRAKLLFDFNIEHDPYSVSCGALLLTMFVSEQQHQVNSTWLSAAIMHAKAANAHLYSHDQRLPETERRRRKVLWWGCILQDRIIALGLRRPLQITPEQFDFTQPCLGEEDFREDFKRSKVYDETTKVRMVEILILMCKLSVVLTQTINTVYPQNGFSRFATHILDSTEELSKVDVKLNKAREGLHAWSRKAKKLLRADTYTGVKENVTLFKNIVFLYHCGAKSALAHYEALLVETYLPPPNALHDERLKVVAHELQDTSTEISMLFKEIMGLKIAQNMPISAVAYIAFPLVLNTLDLKLAPTSSQTSPKKRQLGFYSEAMRMCEARYEGTTKLAMIVQKLVTFAAHESRKLNRQPMVSWPSASAPEDGSEIKDWLGVLVKHPKLYLRVSMSLDLSMARGKYPNQRDMPESLFWGHSENEPATLAAGSLLGRNINVGLAGEIRKPNRTAPSIPRALGNIAMEFSFSPKARWMRDPAKEGTDFDVNLDFMEINVNDATAKRNQAHQTATDEREGLEDDILDWPVDLSGES